MGVAETGWFLKSINRWKANADDGRAWKLSKEKKERTLCKHAYSPTVKNSDKSDIFSCWMGSMEASQCQAQELHCRPSIWS
jgi:hypothetical protein